MLAEVALEEPIVLGELDLPEKTDPDQGVITEAVRTWLEKNKDWLLVFDNAEDFEDLERYLPRAGSGHVIITSRKQTWSGVAEIVDRVSPEAHKIINSLTSSNVAEITKIEYCIYDE